MFVALNKNGERVLIENASINEEYFCPTCHSSLIQKRGSIKVHHFAHSQNSPCSDMWNYDMSEWHKWWQSLFPVEQQEIVMEANGEKHRADVLVNDIVIEFQHSPISCDEFNERNKFYTNLGYKVAWIFDLRDKFDNEQITNIKNSDYKFRWNYAFHTLDDYDPEFDKNIIVYFHYDNSEIDDGSGEEHPYLYKLVWIGDEGLKWFAVDKKVYHEFDIKEFKGQVKAPIPSRVFNDMVNDHMCGTFDHGYKFKGCPISKSGYAVTDIDYSGDRYGKCRECKYIFDYFKCNYPEKYLEIPNDAKILEVTRDGNKFVKSVTYLTKDGKQVTKEMPSSMRGCSTIIDLWIKNNVEKVAIFRDVQTDYFVKVSGDPRKQVEKYGQIYGVFSKDQYRFPMHESSKAINSFNTTRWTIVWFK